jgi:quinol monooxygenase YgiN
MIAVMGVIEVGPGQVDALRGAMATMAKATRAEPGCMQYVFSVDIDSPDRVLVSELWQDDAALTAHFATAHMAAFNAAIAGADLRKVNVRKLEIAAVSQLMGSDA